MFIIFIDLYAKYWDKIILLQILYLVLKTIILEDFYIIIYLAWEPINRDNLPELSQIIDSNAQLLEYITKHTGWKKSIKSASDLADNILEMVSFFLNLQMAHFAPYIFSI